MYTDSTHTHTQKKEKKNPLTTIKEFFKVAGYKDNKQKSAEFLKTNDEENNSMYNSINKNTKH